MTVRVLLVTHKSADGYPTARAEYCAPCGVSLTREVQHAQGLPTWRNSITGVTVYGHADGSTEHHEWVDRRAVICCGAGCVQQMGRTA